MFTVQNVWSIAGFFRRVAVTHVCLHSQDVWRHSCRLHQHPTSRHPGLADRRIGMEARMRKNAEQCEAVLEERDRLRKSVLALKEIIIEREHVAAQAVALEMLRSEKLEMDAALMRNCLERLRVDAMLKNVTRKEIREIWPDRISVSLASNSGKVGLAVLASGINFRHAYGAAGDLDGEIERKAFRVFATQIDEYELLESPNEP